MTLYMDYFIFTHPVQPQHNYLLSQMKNGELND